MWAKPLADGSVAALALNRSPLPITANVTWAMLGWDTGKDASVRDLWAHAERGVFQGSYVVSVAPHDVAMVRVTPVAIIL